MNEFDKYLTCWELIADGAPIFTSQSKLLPVRYKNTPCMLKVATSKEERDGGSLMVWWGGLGSAKIFAHDAYALLMERAIGSRSLTLMAQEQHDTQASLIICDVVGKLHSHKQSVLPSSLIPLDLRFRALYDAASTHGGIFRRAATVAQELLKYPESIVVLHGDIHHGNILDFSDRGWLAIDPKGLLGERGFDYANIFCNPDWDIATKPGRLEQQATVIARAAGLDRTRLLQWILAYAGLSAAWHLEDETNSELAITIANRAATALNIG